MMCCNSMGFLLVPCIIWREWNMEWGRVDSGKALQQLKEKACRSFCNIDGVSI